MMKNQPQKRTRIQWYNIEQAYLYGLNGVPASVFNNKYLVSGAQPYETLRTMVEKIEVETMGQE